MAVCQNIISNKGKPKLVLNGYGFNFDREGDNGQYYWYCDKSYQIQTINEKKVKRRLCKTRLVTRKNSSGDHIVLVTRHKHSHNSLPAFQAIKVNITKMKGEYLKV